ncbi:HAD-IA family hydrolase [Methyloligella sp. 2.7D]|uniref:HAD-IA family hydrolase n=1 Tax=unclassified Methyloligella TaxID=2625955 RepID=UPI00157D340C|nr:HAD-IA family hydrolase [Methyloligella sp. GL2]QKP76170.1 HAD-IA family hydrolase [Methyloligella sp. GL2]
MQRCLMLDVDGVVVNGRPEDGKSWATDIERDLGIAPDRLREIFFEPHWPDIVIGRTPLLEALEACLPALSASVTAQDFIAYWFAKDSALDDAVLADCAELRARGMRIFLATNQEHLRARHLMEQLGLRDHVDGMIYSAAVAARKPSRAFFDAAAAHSGAAPENIVLIDDTKANVDAARETGWQAAHWSPGASLLALLETR